MKILLKRETARYIAKAECLKCSYYNALYLPFEETSDIWTYTHVVALRYPSGKSTQTTAKMIQILVLVP